MDRAYMPIYNFPCSRVYIPSIDEYLLGYRTQIIEVEDVDYIDISPPLPITDPARILNPPESFIKLLNSNLL